ncbi:Regulatory protein BlaR1 [Posidoniimonas corsicana]|uniref:Regulatory protein BlaR1 n=1 Tax=Posidoniimonas corsicana TaxID=1938618 RepID=A0A5C5VHP3_9BACT|nr:M56 family metallopeptidase [Posidoniimonas corsicana]TWT38128.1 Regulatory protein BlaR1 [Posidoniimonas corsicana]
MISSEALVRWLVDFHLASAALLAAALLTMRLLRQPAHRIAIAWATCGAVALAGLLYATPGWSSIPLVAAASSVQEQPVGVNPSGLPAEQAAQSAPLDLPQPAFGGGGDAATAELAEVPSTALPVLNTAELALLAAAVGAACVLVWLAAGSVGASRLVAAARPAREELAELVQGLWGGGAAPALLVHGRLDSPVALNLLRPTVLLPASLADEPADSLRPLLTHELTHLRNGDLWLLAATRCLMVLLWANPLFWLLRRRIRFDQERLADAAAAHEGDRFAYAEQLVAWARAASTPPRVAGAVGLWESRSQLQRRVAALLDTGAAVLSRCSARWRYASVAGCLAVGVGVSLLTMTPPSLAQDKPEEADPAVEDGAGLTYTGVVVDSESGEPIEGAEVLIRIRTSSQNPWPVLGETTHPSGKDGKYKFTIAPDRVKDKYLYIEVEATHPDYARKSPSGYALSMIRKNEELGEEPFFSRIELRPAEHVSGRLLRPDGAPAVGVRVLIYSKTNPLDFSDYGSFADTKTDDQGRFALNSALGGPAVLWFLPQDLAPETHLLEASNPDAWKTKEGDNQGYAVFVPNGGEENSEPEKPLRLTGGRTDLGEFTLTKGLKMRGRVVNIDGSPLPGVWVNASLRSGPAKKAIRMPVSDSIERSALTNEEGVFEMAPLPPGGYQIVPSERPEENPDRSREERPLPATFLVQQVELNEQTAAEPIELRATETVRVRTQNLDSKGEPTRGHGYSLVGFTTEDRQGFFAVHPDPDSDGATDIAVPKGLWHVELRFTTNEHHSLRVRQSPEAPLSGEREFKFERLTEDLGPIEVVKYKAPILLVKPVDQSGKLVKDTEVQIRYDNQELRSPEGSRFIRGGGAGDVGLEPQQDGRWRTSQLLPDEPFELTITAPGREPAKQRFELKEGETEEVDMSLKPAAKQAP